MGRIQREFEVQSCIGEHDRVAGHDELRCSAKSQAAILVVLLALVGCGNPREESISSIVQAATVGPCSFTTAPGTVSTEVAFGVRLAPGAKLEQVGLAATGGELHLSAGAQIVASVSGFASVSSLETSEPPLLASGANVSDVFSSPHGPIVEGYVHGSVATPGDLVLQGAGRVDGALIQSSRWDSSLTLSFQARFPTASRGSCSLGDGGVQEIDPAAYGAFVLASGSRAKLGPGTYFFDSLHVQSNATLELTNSTGPIFIYVREALGLSGMIVSEGASNNVLFATSGTGVTQVSGSFRGVVVAPESLLNLGAAASDSLTGFFYGRSIVVAENVTVRAAPFSQADLCSGSLQCSTLCPCVSGGTCHSDDECAAGFTCVGETPNSPGACGSPQDDGDPCTADSIDASGVIVHVRVPAGTPCEDGNACNGLEACSADGACGAGVPPDPDDGNPCTVDICDALTGPAHAPAPRGTSCTNGVQCDGMEECDGNGGCAVFSRPSLSDGNPCTSDRCDLATGTVTHQLVAAGTACSDGDSCNGVELCNGVGNCLAGTPPLLDDGDPCTIDWCDSTFGVVHERDESEACEAARVGWETMPASAPSPREAFAAVYDPALARLVTFGGENGGSMLGDTWTYAASERRWRREGRGPSPRAGAAAIYDTARQRVVLFGGVHRGRDGSRYYADIWEYDSARGIWAERVVNGPKPLPRALPGLTYDSARNRVVLFGGAADDALGDTWEWDPATGAWSERVAPLAPSARYGAGFVFDPVHGVAVLHGGSPRGVSGVSLNDTWHYDGASGSWVPIVSASAPSPRAGHALVYDPSRGKALLFGGTDASTLNLSDTWEYETATQRWSELVLERDPPGRSGHASWADGSGGMFVAAGVVFSGNGLQTRGLADVWQLDHTSNAWAARDTSLAPALLERGIAFDVGRGRLVTRSSHAGAHRTTWEYLSRDQRWEALEVNEPTATEDPFDATTIVSQSPLVYVPHRESTFVVGGTMNIRVREWRGGPWLRRCDVLGTTANPIAVDNYSSTYDPSRKRLLLFGGTFSNRITWIDVDTCAHGVEVVTGTPPSTRLRSAVTFDTARNVLVVFGGLNSPTLQGDTWEYAVETGRWTRRATSGPSPRTNAALVYDPARRRILLHGGIGSGRQRDTWEYDPVAGTWTSMSSASGPQSGEVSMAYDSAIGTSVLMSTTGSFWRWTGQTWIPLQRSVAPSARSDLSGGFILGRGLAAFFGGISGDGLRNYLGDVWIWNDGWSLASNASLAGPPRTWFTSVHVPGEPERTGHTFTPGHQNGSEGLALLFGGQGRHGLLRDTWLWNDQTYAWRAGTTHGDMVARTKHATAYVPNRGYVLFGGLGSSGPLNDTWSFGSSWAAGALPANAPPARYAHAFVTDQATGKVVLFGGRDANQVFNDTWLFDPNPSVAIGLRWQRLTPVESPPARFGHSMTYDSVRQRVVLTGGASSSAERAFGDTWEWDRGASTWVERRINPMPPRAGHTSFFDANSGEVIVFGGLSHQDEGRSAESFGDTLRFRGGALPDPSSLRADGTACSLGSECASGQCVDGFCCNSPCNAQCAACNLPGFEGQCRAGTGPPRGGRPPCVDAWLCGNECDGSDMAQCHLALAGQSCGGFVGCVTSGALAESSRCDGNGVCVPVPTPCAPYACCSAQGCALPTDSCRTSCRNNDDCDRPNFWCRLSTSTCLAYAKIATLSVSPNPAPVASTVEILATLEAFGAVTYHLQQPDGAFVQQNCVTEFQGPCRWTATAAGAYTWEVRAKVPSSDRAVDDSRTFEIMVTP